MDMPEQSESSPVIATLVFSDLGDGEPTVSGTTEPGTAPAADRQAVFQLREGMTLRVGRAKTNDVPINNRNVSRFHAVFSASSSGVVLSDLSSLNGTMVNNTRISTPVDISSGDVVTVGDTSIAVKLSLGEGSDGESVHGRTQTAQLAAVVVTVLVVDVVGYTKLSEALPPKDVAQTMHLWFQRISEIVLRHGGAVDKYIGDCVMALWRGSHANAGELAIQAIGAGKEMMTATKVLSEGGEWMHHEKMPWTCRVALNTGEALMGTVGGAGRRDFTVLGDTVNVAFRLESIATKLDTDFIMSAVTADHVRAKHPVRPLGEVNLEGRRGNVSVFTLA